MNKAVSNLKKNMISVVWALGLGFGPMSFSSVALLSPELQAMSENECIENGGNKRCTMPIPTAWTYALCESSTVGIASHGVNWCTVAGGEMDGYACVGATLHAESNIGSRASAYAGSCPMAGDSGWGIVVPDNNCWDGGPTYRGNVLVSDLRSISFNGESCGKFVVAQKGRELTCPAGSSRQIINNVVVCVQPYEHPECGVGNPVLPLTGRKIQTEYDSRSGGSVFSRTYSSTGWHLPYTIDQQLPSFLGQLGHYWRTNFDYRLYRLNSIDSKMGISFPSGAFQHFDIDLNPLGGNYKEGFLEKVDGVFHYRYDGKHLVFSEDGELREYHQSGQPILSLRYSGDDSSVFVASVDSEGNLTAAPLPNGLLLAVENAKTQEEIFDFSYDAAGRLITAKSREETTLYGYDAKDNLISVERLGGDTRKYLYENSQFPQLLTGLIDESGVMFAKWHYDSSARAIASEHADGAEKVQLDFAFIDDVSSPRVTVTNPLGKYTTYHYADVQGIRKITRLEGHASASCAAASKEHAYYDNGTLKSKTDWEGNVTTYVRDDLGREISRTEAAGTADARTITTEYHPTLNKPVKITEPGKVTIMTYDAEGRLTSNITQSTAAL